MRLFLASMAVSGDCRAEDDLADEVCLVDYQAAPLPDRQQQTVPRSATAAGIGPAPVDATSVMACRPSAAREIMSGPEPFEALCRLKC
jgi:hypothetical protein